MTTDLQHELIAGVARAAPPVTVTGLSMFGVGLADWLILVTIVYTVLQIVFLVRDRMRRKKEQDHVKRTQ